MEPANILTQQHNLVSETKFRVKSSLLIVKRRLRNAFSGTKKFSRQQQLALLPVIAVSESNLWNPEDNEQNWILTAGKVQNLRLAAQRLNGIEVDANTTFSFWKQVGNPDTGQGYVVGREIREGCIVPTIAGGLCQLSNALYDAALKANFEIVERHRHTKIIKGSLAEQDRDATVKWNYVDLRFRSKESFRIEIDITIDKLVVRFRGKGQHSFTPAVNNPVTWQPSKLNDCYSCGNFECFKHPGTIPVQQKAVTTFILDDRWSEYDAYIQSVAGEKDVFIVPLVKSRLVKTNRYNWTIKKSQPVKTTQVAAIQRALRLRLAAKTNTNLFSLSLRLDKKVALAAAALIPPGSTHLVVAQNLLPFLWQQGILGGRTYDVLMTRLPIEKIHERLDAAYSNFPASTTLNDFRASKELIELENRALTRARHIITPHKEIAELFNNKSVRLNWALPAVQDGLLTPGNKILFPASARGRKGAYEIKRLAKELGLSIKLAGHAAESNGFWEDVSVEYTGNHLFSNVGLVIYPAYIEHQPRLLLKALAKGIPVIATTACGLFPTNNLSIVPVGDYNALKQAVTNWMNRQKPGEKHLTSI